MSLPELTESDTNLIQKISNQKVIKDFFNCQTTE